MTDGFHPTAEDRKDALFTLQRAKRSMNETAKLIAGTKASMRLSRECIERAEKMVDSSAVARHPIARH